MTALYLDTSAVSLLMRHDEHAVSKLRDRTPQDCVICAPVVAEICFGLACLPGGSKKHSLLTREFQKLRSVLAYADWTEEAAFHFGTMKAALRESGRTVDDMDIAIASCARSVGAHVATANAKHFRVIDGLLVEDWLG